MMDSTVSMTRVVMMSLWGAVVALGVAAWSLGIAGEWNWAFLVGLTACGTSAAAATSHIRCYALGLCALVKEVNTLRRSGGSGSVSTMR